MPLLPRETSCPTELQQPLDGLSSPPRKLSECYRAGKLPEEVSTDQESPTGSPKGAEEGGGQERAQGKQPCQRAPGHRKPSCMFHAAHRTPSQVPAGLDSAGSPSSAFPPAPGTQQVLGDDHDSTEKSRHEL